MDPSRRGFLHAIGATLVVGPFLWPDEAHAKATIAQLGAKIEPGNRFWSFRFRWKDVNDKKQLAEFKVKTRVVRRDLRTPKRLSIERVNKEVAKLINAQPASAFGARVTASVQGRTMMLRTHATNPVVMASSLKKAKRFQHKAMRAALAKRGYLLTPGNLVMPNHARLTFEYSALMKPLVKGLGGRRDKPKAFARHALGFVQSIPYELRALQQDRYRRPFAILAKNKGDCDSKVVLYLAMLRHAWPNLRSAVVYIKGHAFAALDIRPKGQQVGVPVKGRKWVAVEPTGPMLAPLGVLAPSSIQGMMVGFDVRVVPNTKKRK